MEQEEQIFKSNDNHNTAADQEHSAKVDEWISEYFIDESCYVLGYN